MKQRAVILAMVLKNVGTWQSSSLDLLVLFALNKVFRPEVYREVKCSYRDADLMPLPKTE